MLDTWGPKIKRYRKQKEGRKDVTARVGKGGRDGRKDRELRSGGEEERKIASGGFS